MNELTKQWQEGADRSLRTPLIPSPSPPRGARGARLDWEGRFSRGNASLRSAFSLLEMILALALLGTSLGILSQVALTGTDAASEAEHLSQARMIAQSHLAEILAAGITPAAVPPSPTMAMDSQSSTPFQYQVDVVPAPLDGMLAIRISVEALDEDGGPSIAQYSLTRWMIDPALGLVEMAAEEAAMKEEEAASASE